MQEDAHLTGLVQLQNMFRTSGVCDSLFGASGFSVRLRVEEYEIP